MSGLGCSGLLDYFLRSAEHFELLRAVCLYNRDDTSIEANLQFVGSWVDSIWLMNYVVSLTYEDRFLTYSCSHLSTNWDIFSVMLSHLERKYIFEVLCLIGTLQN